MASAANTNEMVDSEKCKSINQSGAKIYKAFREDSNLLPEHQKELLSIRREERVIADYVAAMTDRYAMKTYHEIYGLSL